MSHPLLLIAAAAAGSMNKCIGTVPFDGGSASIIRNTGCASCPWPVAAPASVASGTVQLQLTPGRPDGHKGRNGARVYLGATDSCTESKYNNSEYAALDLLGKTLSLTVNPSSAARRYAGSLPDALHRDR